MKPWVNECNITVAQALRYLSVNDRPSTGLFTSTHLVELAEDIEREFNDQMRKHQSDKKHHYAYCVDFAGSEYVVDGILIMSNRIKTMDDFRYAKDLVCEGDSRLTPIREYATFRSLNYLGEY